jgi:hypothetical protein
MILPVHMGTLCSACQRLHCSAKAKAYWLNECVTQYGISTVITIVCLGPLCHQPLKHMCMLRLPGRIFALRPTQRTLLLPEPLQNPQVPLLRCIQRCPVVYRAWRLLLPQPD